MHQTEKKVNSMIHLDEDYLALKNLRNAGISFADSTEFIFLPCFSDMLCNNSFAPEPPLDNQNKIVESDTLKDNMNWIYKNVHHQRVNCSKSKRICSHLYRPTLVR